MADNKKELTPEELAAKETDEKAKADELAKELAAKEAPKETSEAEPIITEPSSKVYDHMVKYKGKFYDTGTKFPVE